MLNSCTEDDDVGVRNSSCQVYELIFSLLQNPASLTDEMVHQIYPALVKRMDDSSNDVRISVFHALSSFWLAAPQDFIRGTALDYLLDALMIHMDDSDAQIQVMV